MQFIEKHKYNLLLMLLSLIGACLYPFIYGSGISNEPSYLLKGLSVAYPKIWQKDWLVNHTYHYHEIFSYFVYICSIIYREKFEFFIILTSVALRAIFIYYACKLVYIFIEIKDLILYSIFSQALILLIIFDKTAGIAASYILSVGLQPSIISSIFLILSILFFVRNNYLISGIFLGLSGLFHSNFLILNFIFFGLSYLIITFKQFSSRLFLLNGFKLFLPLALVLLYNFPILLEISLDEQSKTSRYIFLNIIAPMHYKPFSGSDNLKFLIFYIFWITLGWISIYKTNHKSDSFFKIKSIYVIFTLLTLFKIIEEFFISNSFISNLFIWRMIPFTILFAKLFCLIYLMQLHQQKAFNFLQKYKIYVLAIYSIIITSLIYCLRSHFIFNLNEYKSNITTLIVVLLLACSGSILLIFISNFRNRILSTFFSSLIFILSILCHHFVYQNQIFHYPSTTQMYNFINNNYKEDQLFLIPPDLESFRLLTKQSIFIDNKTHPLKPSELLEWYRRINLLAGREVKSKKDATEGFKDNSKKNFAKIVKDYNIDFVILRQNNKIAPDINPKNIIYQNDTFLLIDKKEFPSP